MKAKAFYLAFFALFGEHCTAKSPTTSSSHASPDVCAFEPKAKVSDACASYSTLDTLNDQIHPFLRNLANNSDFFSYYRLNLYNKVCPFWNDEDGLCGNIACAVTTVEKEEDLPEIWRAEELSKLEGPKAVHPGKQQQKERKKPLLGELGDDVGESCVVEYDDECDERDYCVPDDESATAKGDYVSLADNPERFTGYAGEGAHQVWEAIYRENCFVRPPTAGSDESSTASMNPLQIQSLNQAQAAMDFKRVMKQHDRQQTLQQGSPGDEALDFADECLEKRVFYRIISGMHASISTHLCHDYLNQTTGEWAPNLQCYKERLHEHADRLSNLYFNYALVLRALGKLKDYVLDYTFCTGDPDEDLHTRIMMRALAGTVPSGPEIFDERVMFQSADGVGLKEDFRNRFRNVSRIMDCVGCDKCRLWGKIQTTGLGTALKVLFEFPEDHTKADAPVLRRNELVALVNTLDKISAALKHLEHFRSMIAAEREGRDPLKVTASTFKGLDDLDENESVNSSDDFSALDDLDDDKSIKQNMTEAEKLWAEIRTEFDLVFGAWVWVLKSWASLPGIIGFIVKNELDRAYDFWIGRPVRPRGYEFRRHPRRDEL